MASSDPIKILLIQLKRAGDVLLATPAAEALKRRFPQATIDFLVDRPVASLLDHHPALRRVIVYDRNARWEMLKAIRAEKYHWVFDFQSSPRSAPLALFSGAKQKAGYRVPFWGRFYNVPMTPPGKGNVSSKGKTCAR